MEKCIPIKGFHIINVESGNDSQRRLWTLSICTFVDVDCYCLWGYVIYGRPHNGLANCQWKILAEAQDLLCYLGLLGVGLSGRKWCTS